MVDVEVQALQQENRDMADLELVLGELIGKPELRSNPVFCELLERFVTGINAHLSHESRSVYRELLNHADQKTNDVASQFISNTHELQKIIGSYTKRWCKASPSAKNREQFMDETQEVFQLLNDRIKMENTHLFPVLQEPAVTH